MARMHTPGILSEGALRLSLILMAFLFRPNIQMPIEWLQTGRNQKKRRNILKSRNEFERQKKSFSRDAIYKSRNFSERSLANL